MPRITPDVVHTVQMLRYELEGHYLLTRDDILAALRILDEAGLFAPADAWLVDLTARLTGAHTSDKEN